MLEEKIKRNQHIPVLNRNSTAWGKNWVCDKRASDRDRKLIE